MKDKKKCKTCNFHIKDCEVCAGIESKHFGENVPKDHWCGSWQKLSEEKVKFMELDE